MSEGGGGGGGENEMAAHEYNKGNVEINHNILPHLHNVLCHLGGFFLRDNMAHSSKLIQTDITHRVIFTIRLPYRRRRRVTAPDCLLSRPNIQMRESLPTLRTYVGLRVRSYK